MKISQEKLLAYRTEKYYLNPGQKLRNLHQAEQFVNERGFVFFWPIKGVELPSLWTAAAGNRPVANAHDDPGHITWGWKDESLGKRIWYYGKVLRKKATLISLDIAPNFYALSRNFGNPEEDILINFSDGLVTKEAKTIFEVILEKGPMDTVALRHATHMTGKESDYPYERAMTFLQSDFKILPVGISDAGAWHYAFIYDLVHRHYSDIPIAAHEISQRSARTVILETFLRSVGAAQFQDLIKLFGWPRNETRVAIEDLVSTGKLQKDVKDPQCQGEWVVLEEVMG